MPDWADCQVRTPTLSAAILAEADPQSRSSVAIIADGQLSVAALAALVSRDPGYRVVQEARGTREVRQALIAFNPAVAVVESSWAYWRGSIESPEWSGRTLLLLDPEDEVAEFVRAVRDQGTGYLSRSASRETLEHALVSLRETGSYLDPDLAEQIIWAKGQAGPALVSGAELSHRQRDILIRVASGLGTKEIAREYAITPKTVGNHINNIYQKLNLSHRGELVLYAVQNGMATIPATA